MLEKGRRNVTTATSSARFVLRVLIAVVFVCALVWMAPTVAVHAQTAIPDTVAMNNVQTAATAAGVDGSVGLMTLIGRIINVFFGVLGVIILGYVLYAGYLWMTANGDPKQVEKAKDTLKNAVIGLLIIASAFAITTFIMLQLEAVSTGSFGAGGDGSGDLSLNGFPNRAGALGDVIHDVYPMPGAHNVPRNTAIMVTFSMPVKISSFIDGYNDNGTPADLTDDIATSTHTGLNVTNIHIFRTAEGRTRALGTSEVRVRFTPDRRTFVMRPVAYLGSSDEPQDYTVELTGGATGIQLENNQPVFSGLTSRGYAWQFQVSTVADLTPPQVTTAMPMAGGLYAPNVVIQMNFNEPMDPTSMAGVVHNGGGFDNIAVGAHTSTTPVVRPDGEFRVSNGYQTVEFTTNLACGMNSCGRQVFCLPADSIISVDAKAATLESASSSQAAVVSGLYDGLVDAAGNSLDGNRDGKASGPPLDTYSYPTFRTTATPDLSAPYVRRFTPAPETGLIPVDQTPTANFDSVLQASTVNASNVKDLTNEPPSDTFWFRPRMTNMIGDREARPGENASSSMILIDHRNYAAPAAHFVPQYYPLINSGVQNLYQNCFNPTSSDNSTMACHGTSDRPNCCFVNGVATPSASACPYPVTSQP